jgi:VPDSG-CTERM motif
MKKTIKCLLATAVACASLGFASQASALLIGDAHELGFVNFGIPSGDQDRENYVNHLIDMALGSSDTFSGQDFKRSNNDFGPLADAKFDHNGTSNIGIDVTGFDYLFAKYDGPNYGSEVWFVGDLSGVITIPATAKRYGLSGWTLFTSDPGTNVPDGGATVVLLGAALMGLAVLRARLQKA